MIRVSAPAKINFFLEITGKRPDGYHTLSTVFQTISLSDQLTLHPSDRLELTCSDLTLPTDESNLVMRAAMRLQNLLKEPRGARIHLEKKTPMGAGLGGGSSDAAAVLLALLKLWKRRALPAALHKLARTLGADVPFFLKGGLCIGRGIGDLLTPLPKLPKTWIVLVYPDFGVATKGAYARVRLPFANPRRLDQRRLTENLFNRFEDLVFPDHPALPELKRDLVSAGAQAALMSGSGSTMFGWVASKAQGEKVLAQMKKRYNQSWLVHTLPSQP